MSKLLTALVALAFVGCATPSTTTMIVSTDDPLGFAVVSVNPSLSRSAEPVELKRGMAADGSTPKISLLLQNSTSWVQRLNYRIEWLDAQGMALPGQVDVVRPATVPSGSYKSIESVAPSSSARNFRIWLTEAGGASATR